MSDSTFYRYFLGISSGTAALLLGIAQLDLLRPFLNFSLVSLVLFMALTLAMFLVGKITAKSSNKSLFTGMVLGFTFGKIFLSIVIVIGYFKFGNPPSRLFILPFFIVYLVFTIFETYIMMQIGQQSKPIKKRE